MKKEPRAGFVYIVASLVVILSSFVTRSHAHRFLNLSGMFLFIAGMLLFLCCVLYLGRAFLGTVEPRTTTLVKTGPYRFIRHPLYLATLLCLIGISLLFGSIWGVATCFLFFLPAAIHRATLEERALDERFGETWKEYKKNSHFMIPFIY